MDIALSAKHQQALREQTIGEDELGCRVLSDFETLLNFVGERGVSKSVYPPTLDAERAGRAQCGLVEAFAPRSQTLAAEILSAYPRHVSAPARERSVRDWRD